MTDTRKRLSGPALLTGSPADKYTAPDPGSAVIREISVCNVTGTPATLFVSIGTDGTGTRLISGVSIPANSVVQFDRNTVLGAGEKIQAHSGTASALNLTISGVESEP